MTERTCGGCRWIKDIHWGQGPYSKVIGQVCAAPIPIYVTAAFERRSLSANVTAATDATGCECFERREESGGRR